jgi:5'(3')-deoxyribonucleotidase
MAKPIANKQRSGKTARFILGVDLDGVVADFYGRLRVIAAEYLGVPIETLPEKVKYGLPEWRLNRAGGYEALHRFAVTQRNLFSQLIPLPGAPAVLRRLSAKNIRIRIITHRLYIKYFHLETVQQTTEWLEHHGIPYWDLCFMKDKAAVGADLYLEDAPTNVNALRANGHPTIVFTNSTNLGLPGPRADSWDEVEDLVLQKFKEWKNRHNRKKGLSGA